MQGSAWLHSWTPLFSLSLTCLRAARKGHLSHVPTACSLAFFDPRIFFSVVRSAHTPLPPWACPSPCVSLPSCSTEDHPHQAKAISSRPSRPSISCVAWPFLGPSGLCSVGSAWKGATGKSPSSRIRLWRKRDADLIVSSNQ